MMIENFNISKYNNDALAVIEKSITGEYHLVSGLSSYNIDKEFLFKEELKPLVMKIQECISEYIRTHEKLEFDYASELEASVISSSWFNILGKGHKVDRHRHVDSWDDREGSVVSGAYYPYVDEGSAPLVFTFPEKKVIEMPCSSGSLVIFPSWLDHHTLENKTDKRVTVSFNTVRKSVALEMKENNNDSS